MSGDSGTGGYSQYFDKRGTVYILLVVVVVSSFSPLRFSTRPT